MRNEIYAYFMKGVNDTLNFCFGYRLTMMRKMKANVFMAAYFMTLPLIIVAQNANGIAKISMLLPQDQSSNYTFHFQFSNETFQQFYSCLRYSSWRKCIGSVWNYPPPPFSHGSADKYVASVWNENQAVTFVDPDYFECKYDANVELISCQRYESPCNKTGYFSFSLCNSTYCDLGCVRILSSRGEEIRQENTDVVKTCSVSCKQSTTSVTELVTTVPSQSPVPSSQTTVTAAESSTHGSAEQTKEQARDSNIPIIAAVVSGCAAIILIGIIISILLWRRKHRSRSKAQHTQNVPFSGSSVANSGNHEQNVQNSDFQANSPRKPEKPRATVTSYENEMRSSNNNDIDYGYSDIGPPYAGNGYRNVLHHREQGKSTRLDVTIKHKHDPDYEIAANLDPYNEAATSPEVEADYSENTEIKHLYNEGSTPEVYDDYSENAVLPSTYDDYSTTRNDKNLQIIDMVPHPKNVYAKLGEDFRDIKNPYNIVSQKKNNPNSKNPRPESLKPDGTSYETVDDSVKIVNISKPSSQSESSLDSHYGSNQSDMINNENGSKNNVTTDFPESAIVTKHKENTSKPKIPTVFSEYAVVRKQKK